MPITSFANQSDIQHLSDIALVSTCMQYQAKIAKGLNAIPVIASVGSTYANFGLWAVALLPAWLVVRTIGVKRYNDESEYGDVDRSENIIDEKRSL